jgi:hypothetical protein
LEMESKKPTSTRSAHEKHKPPSRTKSEKSSSSRDGARQSIRRSHSSRRSKEFSGDLQGSGAAKLEASASSLSRKSSSCRGALRSASVRPDDDPIAVNPVEGRKAMKLYRYESESSLLSISDPEAANGKGSFAQLQIPGIDCDQPTMEVQYEDC